MCPTSTGNMGGLEEGGLRAWLTGSAAPGALFSGQAPLKWLLGQPKQGSPGPDSEFARHSPGLAAGFCRELSLDITQTRLNTELSPP